MMSDIEKSFTFLHENIPSWFTHLTEIEEKVIKMQNEIEKVPVSISPPMKRKTGSVESIRDINMDAILEEPSTSTNVQPSHFTSTRKRKTPSIISGQGSGPLKFRSRTMIIVLYDGQIQKQFESLVRNVGTARNMLRKGKMAAKMESMAGLAAFDDDNDNSDDDDDEPELSKVEYRPRPGLATLRATRARARMGGLRGAVRATSGTAPEIFDTTDKVLEQAQGLCEKAAHQSLRDGDCRKELTGIRKYLEEVLEKAEKESAKYSAREEEAKAEPKFEVTSSPPVFESFKPSPISKADTHPIPTIPITASKAMDIEVDEDEEDDIEFVMPPIRLTSRV